jgi:hypothetical protein
VNSFGEVVDSESDLGGTPQQSIRQGAIIVPQNPRRSARKVKEVTKCRLRDHHLDVLVSTHEARILTTEVPV